MIATAVDVRDEQLEVIRKRATNGYLRIYGGQQPAGPESRKKIPEPLATLRFGSPAFRAPDHGAMVSEPLTPDREARATGRATWYRVFQEDGETPIWDGDVSKKGGGGSLELDAVEIQLGAEVSIRSINYSLPA